MSLICKEIKYSQSDFLKTPYLFRYGPAILFSCFLTISVAVLIALGFKAVFDVNNILKEDFLYLTQASTLVRNNLEKTTWFIQDDNPYVIMDIPLGKTDKAQLLGFYGLPEQQAQSIVLENNPYDSITINGMSYKGFINRTNDAQIIHYFNKRNLAKLLKMPDLTLDIKSKIEPFDKCDYNQLPVASMLDIFKNSWFKDCNIYTSVMDTDNGQQLILKKELSPRLQTYRENFVVNTQIALVGVALIGLILLAFGFSLYAFQKKNNI